MSRAIIADGLAYLARRNPALRSCYGDFAAARGSVEELEALAGLILALQARPVVPVSIARPPGSPVGQDEAPVGETPARCR